MHHLLTETLSNIVRHADASRAKIVFTFEGSELKIAVTDNGRGFDRAEPVAADRGFGLVGMRERVEALQGKSTILSHPGKGIHVRASIPILER